MHRIPKTCLWQALIVLLVTPAIAQQNAPPQQAPSVSDQVIQQVLEPLRTGMETPNIDQVLSLFDKQELTSYSDLQGQLVAFFQQFDEVNFRYQLLQVTAEKDRASAAADVQMDALPFGFTQVPVRRSVQMRFQLKQTPNGWKIAGFTPGDFFNVDYSPQ
jgi:hypothetical protein